MAHSVTDAKMMEMQAEMDRFEKELAGQLPHASYIAPPPPPPTGLVNMVPGGLHNVAGSHVISARTFHQVQRQLLIPPPPPPSIMSRVSPMFVPHQVKRPGAFIPPPPPPPTIQATLPTAESFNNPLRPSFSSSDLADSSNPYAPFEDRFNPRPAVPKETLLPVVISTPPGAFIAAPPKLIYSAAPVLNKPKVEEVPTPETKVEPLKTASPAPLAPPTPIVPDAAKSEPGPSGVATAGSAKKEKKKKDKRNMRMAGGETWEDPTLSEWDPDDFRIFVGDIGNEVTDDHLTKAFCKFPSFQKAKVVRDKRNNKSKGFGFVSFKDPQDFIKAMRELNGKYIGNRPMKLRKSNWKDRNMDLVRKKEKEKKKLGLR